MAKTLLMQTLVCSIQNQTTIILNFFLRQQNAIAKYFFIRSKNTEKARTFGCGITAKTSQNVSSLQITAVIT